MKLTAALPGAAALAIALAACGAGHSTPRSAAAGATPPKATTPASPATAPVSAAAGNERLFADAMAASIPALPAQAVAGPLMRAYARFQRAFGAAMAAVGQPEPAGSTTQMAGGFKLCWQAANGTGCEGFTQFTTNHAGQITGVSVNGQPVAGRIATAPAAAAGGLTISNVVAYRLTNEQNVVVVAFKLTDTGYRPINTSPALVASLGGASDDVNQDALPATLAPGDSLYAAAGFDVTQLSGLFCLQPNDGHGEQLPCTTLSKV